MRALIQRVTEAGVYIKSQNYSAEIKKGLVILLGIKIDDKEEDAIYLADKCANIRLFEDEKNKMNHSLTDIMGEVLIISQFTLYGDTHRGNRPSFTNSAKLEIAQPLYKKFIQRMKFTLGEEGVKAGMFGEMMSVKIINDGPVTVIVESKNDKKE